MDRKVIGEVRVFNARGADRYRELVFANDGDLADSLLQLVFDPDFTIGNSALSTPWSLPNTRLQVGEELHKYVGAGGTLRSFAADHKLWDWLSAVYLSESRLTNELAAGRDYWVYNGQSQRYYRHNFYSSYFLYESHIEDLKSIEGLLYRQLAEPRGELLEQVTATGDIAHTVGARLISRLYFDAANRRLKPGASSKGDGSVRRLTAGFLNQIKLNVDFKSMSVEDLMEILPEEFHKFRDGSVSETVPEDQDDDGSPNFDSLYEQAQFD